MKLSPKISKGFFQKAALNITLTYFLLAGGWVFFSDYLLFRFINDPDLLTHLQTIKGGVFILVTAFILYILIKKHFVKEMRQYSRFSEIVMSLSMSTEEALFNNLAKSLAELLNVDKVLIYELTGEGNRELRTRGAFPRTSPDENLTCLWENGPCERIFFDNKPYLCPSGLKNLYASTQTDAESFYGMPLFDSAGHLIGLIAIFHGKPLAHLATEEDILLFFSTRASIELDRVRGAEIIKENERLLRVIFDEAYQLMGLMKPDGTLIRVNRTVAETTGTVADLVVGMPLWEAPGWAHSTELQHRLKKAIQQAASGHFIRFEATHPLPNGRMIDLDFSIKPVFNENGEVTLLVPEGRDITAQKRTEKQLHEIIRDLNAFVYAISHDLRDPLTPVIGFADVLLERNQEHLDGESLSLLQDIADNGRKCISILEDLLTLSSVGQLDRPAEPVKIEKILRETVAKLDLSDNKSIVIQGEEFPEAYIPTDMLTPLLQNLISNALRYAGTGNGPIEIGGDRRGERIHLYVRDHGPGIAEEKRTSIFDAFYRGEASANVKGTGIGLAIVQKIAVACGGKAWIEKTPGGGATFRVELVDNASLRKSG